MERKEGIVRRRNALDGIELRASSVVLAFHHRVVCLISEKEERRVMSVTHKAVKCKNDDVSERHD